MKIYKEFKLKNGKILIVRSAEPEDAKIELEIYKKKVSETPFLSRGIDDEFPSEEDFIEGSKWYNENKIAFSVVAVLDGKIVGTGHLDWCGSKKRFKHSGSLDMGLLKDYWGLGIGGKIMQTILEQAQESGLEQIGLSVFRNNKRAIALYESFGFIVTGIDPRAVKYADGNYDDELNMVKFFKEVDKDYSINY